MTAQRRAIILAAGVGKRMAPLSYELPKALLSVRGEVLIERLISQLRESGVDDVTVVTGYMKESLFYLEDELGAKIRVNADYADTGSASSLLIARDMLANAWVCSSDQYFEQNPFLGLGEESACSVMERPAAKGELRIKLDEEGFVCAASVQGSGRYVLEGPAFFCEADGIRFASILEEDSQKPGFSSLLWDQVFAQHVGDIRFRARKLAPQDVHEFKSFNDLVAFDRDFVENVDLTILDNICATLGCERRDISEVIPIKQGLTNLSFRFDCKGETYVYRHPGAGTDEIINRAAETHALNIARELGLDETFVYEDPEEGWKLSRFIEGCEPFDYENLDQVRQALGMAKRLHESGKTSPWSFDYRLEAEKIADILRAMHYPLPRDFSELAQRMGRLADHLASDGGAPVLCHNDFYGPNLLVRGDEMQLIDWEYSAMGDYACDLGNFVAQGSNYPPEKTLEVIDLYYGRPATPAEQRHCLAAVALVGWYWYVWAIYKGAKGSPVGEWLYIWYRAARTYCDAAMPLYEEEAHE